MSRWRRPTLHNSNQNIQIRISMINSASTTAAMISCNADRAIHCTCSMWTRVDSLFYDELLHTQSIISVDAETDPTGVVGAIAPAETYESYFIHHDFVQFGKQYSWCKVTFSAIVLSQQCCEGYFISFAVVNP